MKIKTIVPASMSQISLLKKNLKSLIIKTKMELFVFKIHFRLIFTGGLNFTKNLNVIFEKYYKSRDLLSINYKVCANKNNNTALFYK